MKASNETKIKNKRSKRERIRRGRRHVSASGAQRQAHQLGLVVGQQQAYELDGRAQRLQASIHGKKAAVIYIYVPI